MAGMKGKRTKKSRTPVRRFAGEAVGAQAMTPAEEQRFLRRFAKVSQRIPAKPDSFLRIPPSTVREREDAARLSAFFFLENCPGPREEVLDALATATALPVRLRQWYGEPDDLLLGAALWFLDYIERRHLKRELASLLSGIQVEDEEELDLDLPLLEDLSWPRETLLRLFTLLEEREDNRAFRKLLKLVRKEDAAALRSAFRDAVLDYFIRYYEIESRLKPTAETETAPAPLAPLPAVSELFKKEREKPRLPGMKAEEAPDIHFLLQTPKLLGASEKKIQSALYVRRSTEKLAGYTVRHPYDICAAAVLLEAEGDLLWSLNTLTDAAVLCALRALPWAMQEAEYQKPLQRETRPDLTPRLLFQTPEEDEKIPLGNEIEEGELVNEEQLFYLATGYLLPRHSAPNQEVEDWFRRQGISPDRAHELALYAMVAGRLDEREEWLDEIGQPSPWGAGWRPMEDEEEPEEQAEAGERADGESREEDRNRAIELARQLKEARGALHDAEQALRQLQSQLSQERQDAMRNKLELDSLRGALFRMRSPEQPEEQTPDSSVTFPWTGRRRILVFGGHDTWSKAIRPMLPGVRFFDRELLPDLNAIKGADILWIQSNALSHKFYYRIIDTARKENIPVRYFGFASARKCAEQLVEEELSAE